MQIVLSASHRYSRLHGAVSMSNPFNSARLSAVQMIWSNATDGQWVSSRVYAKLISTENYSLKLQIGLP